MLISLHDLVNKYNIVFTGILHVGAHECEEINEYEQYISRDKILWIDALHHKVNQCKDQFSNLLIEQAVVSDKIEDVVFNIANNDQSSSMLELGIHKFYHSDIEYVISFKTKTTLLSSILPKYDIKFNFLNLDIQGAELKALKGMENYLNDVDYIYIEVNTDYLYVNGVLIDELDEYLLRFQFKRVELCMTEYDWGDAFYIKLKS
jgi:FkbM family methyltransferase